MCQSEDGRCCTHKQRFVHLCGNIVLVAKHLCDNGNDNDHDEHADEDDSKDDGIFTHGWLDTQHFTQSIYDNKFRHHKHNRTQKGQHTVQANKLLHPEGFAPQRFFSGTIPSIFAPSFYRKALHQEASAFHRLCADILFQQQAFQPKKTCTMRFIHPEPFMQGVFTLACLHRTTLH